MKKSTIVLASVGAIALFGLSAATSYSIAGPHGGPGMGRHGGDHMCGRGGKHGGHKGWGRGHHRKGGMRHMMDRFDTNDDGKLTQDEINESLKGVHTRADANKDGELTLEEFKTAWLEVMNRRMVRHFQRLDEDGNAKLTVDEAMKPFKDVVEMRDRNGDGVLDKDDRRRRGKWWGGRSDEKRGPKKSDE